MQVKSPLSAGRGGDGYMFDKEIETLHQQLALLAKLSERELDSEKLAALSESMVSAVKAIQQLTLG